MFPELAKSLTRVLEESEGGEMDVFGYWFLREMVR